jgi:hypothetical protein
MGFGPKRPLFGGIHQLFLMERPMSRKCRFGPLMQIKRQGRVAGNDPTSSD